MKPTHLTLWTIPSSYAGTSWDDYYIFLSRNRDSDCLTESNFDYALKAIGEITGEEDNGISNVAVVRETHWACGWVEWIAIHKDNSAALEKADEIMGRLEDYPVLNEEDFSQRETDEANDIWAKCYNTGERIKYMRDHYSQFEFHSFADMLGCARGNYFSGYASELIN